MTFRKCPHPPLSMVDVYSPEKNISPGVVVPKMTELRHGLCTKLTLGGTILPPVTANVEKTEMSGIWERHVTYAALTVGQAAGGATGVTKKSTNEPGGIVGGAVIGPSVEAVVVVTTGSPQSIAVTRLEVPDANLTNKEPLWNEWQCK